MQVRWRSACCSWCSGVTAFVVFVEKAQRRIPVDYAGSQVGARNVGETSHLPLKINMSGVIPPIFASSLLLFLGDARGSPAADALGPAPPAMQDVGVPRRATASRCTWRIYAVPDHLLLLTSTRAEPPTTSRVRALSRAAPPGRAQRRYIGPGADAPDAVGRVYVTAVCLIPGRLPMRRALSRFGWHLAPHRGGGGHGLHGAATCTRCRTTTRGFSRKGTCLGDGRSGSGG